jgi:hypothetical protein
VNDQEQIVAGVNDGIFKLGLDIDPEYAEVADVWISN